jgi:hypothetical protein
MISAIFWTLGFSEVSGDPLPGQRGGVLDPDAQRALGRVARQVGDDAPVAGRASAGSPSLTVPSRDVPCHSADEPWHLAPILPECVGKVKPEPRRRGLP